MKLVDANVLLYAVNEDSVHHRASVDWLDHALGGNDTVGFAWLPTTAFLRLSTKVGLFPQPLSPAEAVDIVASWLEAPGARTVEPTSSHPHVLGDLLEQVGTAGNLVSDAHLAAIALERRAAVVTYDTDFGRFPGVRWHRPDDLLEG